MEAQWKSDEISTTEEVEGQEGEPACSCYSRASCAKCGRPLVTCICAALPSKRLTLSSTHILVLQHPNERRKKNTTVPLLPLVLESFTVRLGCQFNASLLSDFADFLLSNNDLDKQKPLLVYPGPNAISLDDEDEVVRLLQAASNIPNSNPSRRRPRLLLIFIDGTWTEAKRMMRKSPDLVQACQLVQIRGNSGTPTATTTTTICMYDVIRKEPCPHFLSTLECCAQVLTYLYDHRHHPGCSPKNNEEDERETVVVQQAVSHLRRALRLLVQHQWRFEQQAAANSCNADGEHYLSSMKKRYDKYRQRQTMGKMLFDNEAVTT
eukprot:scaffold2904_cov173-Amphora_coffeaeformis.AAC.5